MKINQITLTDLRRMNGKEGLILQGCGGEIQEWMDGINKMLKNSKIFEDIAQGNPTLAQKLKDKLKNFIARLKQLLNKINALTHEGKLLEECVTEFENIQKLWDKAVTDGIKTVNTMHAEQKNNTHEGVKYSYGGRVAETADISLLDKAQKMENSGKDSEDIRKETGWFRGYDGKWRFEIDDSKMEIDTADKEYLKKFSSTLLGYLVKHYELFDAYPELKDIYVNVKDTNGEGDAYYAPGKKTITINSDSLNSLSETEFKRVLIHEIQHAIQDIEKFTTGTDTSDFFEYLNTAGEIEAYDTGDRINMDSEQRKNTRPDIDRKDVVFAENSSVSFSQEYKNAKINKDIINLINKIIEKDYKQNEKVYLDNVSNDIAKEIKKLTGINVSNFKVAIEARQIDHIIKDHGENGKADHSMKVDDIAKIQYALKKPDNMTKAGKTQAYSYMRNGKNRTADTVLYEKIIGDKSLYVVQAVVDTNSKTLFIVTAFIGKSGYKKETSQLINTKSPDATSENGSVVVSNYSLLQNGDDVKYQSRNTDIDENIEDLLFDEEFYKPFENEDKTVITESLSELQSKLENMNDDNSMDNSQ